MCTHNSNSILLPYSPTSLTCLWLCIKNAHLKESQYRCAPSEQSLPIQYCSAKLNLFIDLQTLVPWKIAADLSTSTMFTPTASKYADHALSTLGVSHYCCGYWLHGLQVRPHLTTPNICEVVPPFHCSRACSMVSGLSICGCWFQTF